MSMYESWMDSIPIEWVIQERPWFPFRWYKYKVISCYNQTVRLSNNDDVDFGITILKDQCPYKTIELINTLHSLNLSRREIIEVIRDVLVN